jgi:AcrR family transcriptional regulator
MTHFGREGFERATIREIADTAGVAASLVRHHFGSKQGLREACNAHLIDTTRRMNSEIHEDGAQAAATLRPLAMIGPYREYFARALYEGGAEDLFDEVVELTEQWLTTADEQHRSTAQTDRHSRAVVRTAMALSIAVLFDHISRNMTADLLTESGERHLLRTLVDVYTEPLLTESDAAEARAALDLRTVGAPNSMH